MSISTNVPVNIEPEAAAHIAALGYQREFEEMLEHTVKTVPRIQRVDVRYEPDPAGADIPVIVIQPTIAEDRHERDWARWKMDKYPPRSPSTFS
jgi:hypothetical protein